MTDLEKKAAAKKFAAKWAGRGDEKQDTQAFWNSLLRDVYGVKDLEDFIKYEQSVKLDGHTYFIDGRIASTRVLIEQKSLGVDLKKGGLQSDGAVLTPFQQARRYGMGLDVDEHPWWIVVSNFQIFEIHDMSRPNNEPEVVRLEDLEKEYHRMNFLTDAGDDHIRKEMKISLQAGDFVGKLYDLLLKQYNQPASEEELKSLNMLCVRLVFCLYAEDSGLFGGHNKFHDYINRSHAEDVREALERLFKILDTPIEKRSTYTNKDLAAFPYVNGGLFHDRNIIIPNFTEEIVELLLHNASEEFDWSEISPTIFGAVFESTLNPETRRKGGMHYTSIENIHKVIDPLFLDDLKAELAAIKARPSYDGWRTRYLKEFPQKLAKLKFFDPACGSGNFLTETYLSLRRLENEVILENFTVEGQMSLDIIDSSFFDIQVSIGQFYGIEINDFAVTVAKTALWIAESQMLKETEKIVQMHLDFLPLKSYANITEGNALQMKWEDVVPKNQLNYIMGNPPFSAGRRMGDSQRKDMTKVAYDFPKNGDLDYVSAWYIMAARYMQNTKIKAGFVSTSSICQGEQVVLLWRLLFEKYNVKIFHAKRSFNWESEAKRQAGVHCIIVEFVCGSYNGPISIEDGEIIKEASRINGYLLDAGNMWIEGQKKPICRVPLISNGSKPLDNAICAFTPEEKNAFIKKEPLSEPYFYRYMGSREFINNIERWFLLINRIPTSKVIRMPGVLNLLDRIREYRLSSDSAPTKKLADNPAKFHFENMPESNYLVIPQTSSGRRKYVPIGFLSPDVLVNNKLQVMRDGGLYEFGILSSNVHNAWLQTVAGRLRDDFTYSVSVVYNTFPWPKPTRDQKVRIEQTAQAILDARALYPDCSLADLYGERMWLFTDLVQAHQQNDIAVMETYGFWGKLNSPSECVAELMKMYQRLIQEH